MSARTTPDVVRADTDNGAFFLSTFITTEKFKEIEIYQFAAWTLKIANKAIQKTKEENRKLGLPNVFYENGQLYYELDGKIMLTNPLQNPIK